MIKLLIYLAIFFNKYLYTFPCFRSILAPLHIRHFPFYKQFLCLFRIYYCISYNFSRIFNTYPRFRRS